MRPFSRFARRARTCLVGAIAVAALACSGKSLEVLNRQQTASGGSAAAGGTSGGAGQKSEFLSASGDQLYLSGQPYRFLSFNAFTLTGCGNPDELFDDSALDAFFVSLRPKSLVRTYAFRTIDVAGVAAAVRAAAAHGHLLNLVLTDDNGSCGDTGAKKTEEWYASEFRDSYLPWVREVAARFKDEPSVGLWEPISGTRDISTPTLRAFFDEVGAEIRSVDPNHLISSGTHGTWAYGGEADYAFIHQSAGIDVAGSRDYDQNAGVPPSLLSALSALAGSKPLIMGEAGVYASPSGDPSQFLDQQRCLSWAERHDVLDVWIKEAFATRMTGMHVWNYLPVVEEGCGYSIHSSEPSFGLVHDRPIP